MIRTDETGGRPPLFRIAAWKALLVAGGCALVLSGFLAETLGEATFRVAALVALLPLPFYIGLALWLDRMEPEPWLLLAKCVVWGGTAAIVLALVTNHTMFALLAALYGEESANLLSAVLVAPVAEEVAKGVVLVLLFYRARHDFDGLIDGVVYATMVGLGFAATENILYYGYAAGAGDLAATFVIRGLISPYAHSLFTAMFGIGLGYAAHRSGLRARLAPALGLTAGMALHAIWNLSAAVGVFDAAYVLFMVPSFVGAIALALRSQAHEQAVLHDCLARHATAGRLDPDVVAAVCGPAASAKAASRALGLTFWQRRHLQTLVARMALAEWRAARQPGASPPDEQQIERWLAGVRALAERAPAGGGAGAIPDLVTARRRS